MGKYFSKKKGGMPAFGSRSMEPRGNRVPRLLPRSPRDMSLDPRPRDVNFDIGINEPRQRPSPSLNPSVSEFVMPPLSAPAPQMTTRTYQMGAPVVLDPDVSEYVPPPHIQQLRDNLVRNAENEEYAQEALLPPPSTRGNVYYPPRTNNLLYPNMEFSNSATNIPGLPEKDPLRRWWKLPNREGGKQIKKKSSQTRTRQKKRRHSRKTRRNRK